MLCTMKKVWQHGVLILQEKYGCIPHGLSEATKTLNAISEAELTRETVCATYVRAYVRILKHTVVCYLCAMDECKDILAPCIIN